MHSFTEKKKKRESERVRENVHSMGTVGVNDHEERKDSQPPFHVNNMSS